MNDEIALDVVGGHKIVSTVTHESTVELGLAIGKRATALVEASGSR